MTDRNKWCEEYYKTVFKEDFDAKVFDNLILPNLVSDMKKRGLTSIYKYRQGSEQDLINLENNVLASVKYYMFNDPFEYQLSIDSEYIKNYCHSILGNVIDYESPEFLLCYDEIIKIVNDLTKRYNICCLAEEKESLLMWSHYANEHRGYCIEYNIFEVQKMNPVFSPVMYSDNMPIIFREDMLDQLNRGNYTKSLYWSYEKEWRIVTQYNKEVQLLKMPKATAIYLGCRASNDLKEKLSKYCKHNNVDLFESRKNRVQYKLDFNKILI